MVCSKMAVTVPFNDIVWMDIVDHYFDNEHWHGEVRSKYNTPKEWILEKFGCTVNLEDRLFEFSSQEQANWFVMRWL
jgi:hypothetical protein